MTRDEKILARRQRRGGRPSPRHPRAGAERRTEWRPQRLAAAHRVPECAGPRRLVGHHARAALRRRGRRRGCREGLQHPPRPDRQHPPHAALGARRGDPGRGPVPLRADRRCRGGWSPEPARHRAGEALRGEQPGDRASRRHLQRVLARRERHRLRARTPRDLPPRLRCGRPGRRRDVGDVCVPAGERPVRLPEPVDPRRLEERPRLRGLRRHRRDPRRARRARGGQRRHGQLPARHPRRYSAGPGGGAGLARASRRHGAADPDGAGDRRVAGWTRRAGIHRSPRARGRDRGGRYGAAQERGRRAADRARRPVDRRHRLRRGTRHAEHGGRLRRRLRWPGGDAARCHHRARATGGRGDVRAWDARCRAAADRAERRPDAVVRRRTGTPRHVLRHDGRERLAARRLRESDDRLRDRAHAARRPAPRASRGR